MGFSIVVAASMVLQDGAKASPEFRSPEYGFAMAVPGKLKGWTWSKPDGKGFAAKCEHAEVTLEVYAQEFDAKAYAFYDPDKFTKSYEEGARRDFKTVKNKGNDAAKVGGESGRRLTLHVGKEKEVEQVHEYYCFQSTRNQVMYTIVVKAAAGAIDGKSKALRKEVDAILGSFKATALPKKP